MLRRLLPGAGSRGRYKYAIVGALLVLILLAQTLPPLQNTPGSHPQQTPADGRPHFLYRSKFRTNPDLDYEQLVSKALDELAHNSSAATDSGGSPDTLWQVYLGREPTPDLRGDDSVKFEQQNPEWKYKVRDSGMRRPVVFLTAADFIRFDSW